MLGSTTIGQPDPINLEGAVGLIRVRSGHVRFLLYRTSYWGVINVLSLWLLISDSFTMSTEIHAVYIILILYKKDEIALT